MMDKPPGIWGRFAVAVLLLLFLYLTITASIEYAISRSGEPVEALVTADSNVCRSKGKSITVQVGTHTQRLRIYGPSCRSDEFRRGHVIQIRYSPYFDQYALEDNVGEVRLIIYTLIDVALIGVFIHLIRAHRRELAARTNAGSATE